MTRSLRGRLLLWVMLPLVGAVAADAWTSFRYAQGTATDVQDRLLLGSARIIAEQLHYEDGALQPNIPPAALELFESREVDRVYYRVTGSDGQLITGYEELALPRQSLQSEVPVFFGATVRGATVRAVAFLQPVLQDSGVQDVLVEVAETMNGHAQQTRGLWLRLVSRQLLVVALAALLILFGLHQGFKPLLRLCSAVLERRPGSLHPLGMHAVPIELRPLVDAINQYVQQLEVFANAQQVFIQNAAHQLRTPLTLLATQVGYAVRSDDPAVRDESLRAIRHTVQQAARVVNQLLTLSAAEAQQPGELPIEWVSVDGIVRSVVEDLAGQAAAKSIDLGFECEAPEVRALANRVAVREIALNLLDNALRYTQPGGIVTCRLEVFPEAVELTVEDNGPGIPRDEWANVFERFYRVHNSDSAGSGLGLPIVREFAMRMGAEVELTVPQAGHGLAVRVRLRRQGERGQVARTTAARHLPGDPKTAS
ncbi:MAG TPA: sensor histidine kinase [Burkholderiaceae bacterium]|nr:sensor histidine kinase [Burkholderiaceae bacterium]